MKFASCLSVFLLLAIAACAQERDTVRHTGDTTIVYKNHAFTLTDVVVHDKFNIETFINYVKNDTTFYKAFRNLRVLSFSSFNDIRFTGKKGNVQASLSSNTSQLYSNGCRTMVTKDEKTTGDFYDKHGDYNYTTAGMYASLFFTKGKVCGETNIVKGTAFDVKDKHGMDKYREQLKQLFFNPGTRIPGLPFIGKKVALFDDDVAKLYDFRIDQRERSGQLCYVFTITPRADLSPGERNDIVIDEMTTWFNAKTMEILSRNYTLSYKAGVFDFNVTMDAELEKFGDLLVPKVLRYNGYWNVIFKKAERAVFTATLYGFK